jgi:basic membrane lipoprotein Med (substrate-binding protein (PBP1-ABC) superfamily)
VIRAAALLLLAAAAAGCGSDLGPASTAPAAPVRILLVQASPRLAQGVRDAIALIDARTVTDVSQADLVVTAQQSAAAAAARENGGTHILVVGQPPTGAVAANVRVVEFDRGQLAYLAGALAALHSGVVAVAEPGSTLGAAFAAGAHAAGGGAQATSVACGATTAAAVVYVPSAACRPHAPAAQLIAPAKLPGATMLAILRTRPEVVVAAAARSVQDGAFDPGIALEGLREDAIGFAWISPEVGQSANARLQSIEDRVRAGTVDVPSVAP